MTIKQFIEKATKAYATSNETPVILRRPISRFLKQFIVEKVMPEYKEWCIQHCMSPESTREPLDDLEGMR